MKKIKKNRDEKLKAKKKHRSQLPPLSERDILRIKQLSLKPPNSDRDRSSQDDRAEEQHESVPLFYSSVIANRVTVEPIEQSAPKTRLAATMLAVKFVMLARIL